MRSVHVVLGTTGEIDDREEWVVAAFTTKDRAETWVRKATEWLKARGLDKPGGYGRESGVVNPYDDEFRCDYTGTEYFRVQAFLDPPLPTKGQGA